MRNLAVEDVKEIQLSILKIVDQWCRENNVKYFLFYGTLLGAVRHHGYIPWDDDIDICMLRKDYEKFLHEFNNDRDDSIRVLHSSMDHDFPYEFAKVHDLNTTLVEEVDTEYDIGINIDVFVIDNIPEKQEEAQKIIKKIQHFAKIIEAKQMLGNDKKRRPLFKRIAVAIAKKISDLYTMYDCTHAIDQLAKAYKNDNQSMWVADSCSRWFNGTTVYKREWFEPIELEFEGNLFIAPKGYDEILTTLYGDYMTPPPVEEQVTHHCFSAFRKSECSDEQKN